MIFRIWKLLSSSDRNLHLLPRDQIRIFKLESSSDCHVSWRSLKIPRLILIFFRYQSETGSSEDRLIQLPDDVKRHVEIKFSSSDAEDFFAPPSIPSDISCIAIDDVIIASSVDLPTSFYEDFEQFDALKWSWMSNRPTVSVQLTSPCPNFQLYVVGMWT